MNEFDVLAASAAGMDAQRAALNVAARNVAASEAGGEFARLVPRFATGAPDADADDLDATPDSFDREAAGDDDGGFVRFAGTVAVPGSSPDSIAEMVAVLNAERAYEADASVFEAGKRLAERTIDAGRT